MFRFVAALTMGVLCLSSCYRPMNLDKNPLPGNTLILEFATPIKYVLELKVDGEVVPVKYIRKNRRLWIEGLTPGVHSVNIHSVSYVFGPEFEAFKVSDQGGAYYFIQSRKYRSAIPKDRSRVSIRAYRKKLKKEGINVNVETKNGITARFRNN